MEDDNQKNPKYTIINVFGTKYKATHITSSSINNKLLLSLAQIKYFIKSIIKKCIQIYCKYILPIIYEIINNVLDRNVCEFIIITLTCLYLMIAIFYSISIIVNDMVNLTNDFNTFNTVIFKQIVLNSVNHIVYSILLFVFAMITSFIILHCLSKLYQCLHYIFQILFKLLQQLTNMSLENINTFNKQIPNIEIVEQIEEV